MAVNFDALKSIERCMRGPSWRRQLAQDLAAGIGSVSHATVDQPLRRAAQYYKLLGKGAHAERRARCTYPEVAAADVLRGKMLQRGPLQCMVLAGIPRAEVATRTGIDLAIVQTFEEIFFDVREMLRLTGWIVTQVIQREADHGHDELAAQMRVAFFGGPTLARLISDANTRLPADQAQRVVDASMLLHAKFQQALEMPLEPSSREAFLQLWAQIRLEEQRVSLEREKLTARMQRWSQHVELARERTKCACYAGHPAVDDSGRHNTSNVDSASSN